MNERIKKLANIWANRKAEDEKLGITYTFSEPVLEHFANLIVKECIDQIKRVGILEDIENETDMVADAVKEHFGVE